MIRVVVHVSRRDFYDSYYVMGSKKDKGCAAPPIRDYIYLYRKKRGLYIYQTNLFVFPQKDRYCCMLESKHIAMACEIKWVLSSC